jgi:Ca-activated chloride channel family protein
MKLFIFIFLIIASPVYPLAYDSAIYKAQKGNWQDAHSALNSIITHNPDNADAMYDAGVAAYNVGNKCQAATCFKRVAEYSGDKQICFRAHFNAGNMYVDEKNLKAALEEYDKALAIEPDNEYARHNRDRVEQMLKEEENKQNQDQKDKSQQDKNKQNQDKQDNQEQENNEQNKQDQNEKNQNQDQDENDQQKQNGNDQKSQSDNQQQNQKNNNQKNDSSYDESYQQTQRDQGSEGADGRDQTQRKNHGDDKKEQKKNSGNNEKRNKKDELDKQTQNAQSESNEKQSDKHGTTPEKQHGSKNNSNVATEDGQEQGEALNEMAINDPWLLKILDNQEQHDKAINKQLMEAKIRQHGGKNGQQNCW